MPEMGPPLAQSKDTVVGTWMLVTATQTDGKGETKPVFGLKPTGFATYTAGAELMVIITAEGRKPLSVNDRIAAPATERAEAFATMVAYAGRYTFTGDKVVHHVEASWIAEPGCHRSSSVRAVARRSFGPAYSANDGWRSTESGRTDMEANELGYSFRVSRPAKKTHSAS